MRFSLEIIEFSARSQVYPGTSKIIIKTRWSDFPAKPFGFVSSFFFQFGNLDLFEHMNKEFRRTCQFL